MNVRVMRVLFFLTVALVAGVASAQTFNMMLPGKWWERPRVAAQLNLTQAQVAQLEEATLPHARAMIDLKASVERATLDLQASADAVPFDAEKTRTAFRVLQQARQRLETQRFEMLLKVRGVLDTEQWKRLEGLARERRAELGKEGGALAGPGQKNFQPQD